MDVSSLSTHETIRTPAGTVAYRDIGTGPPVVCLHGNPTSGRLYTPLLRTLTPGYRCIVPDHLGFGQSDAPLTPASYRPAAHATRLIALLRRLDLSGVTLVLHDWGGPIGISYALQHPDVVHRLVLTNTWAWPLTHRPLLQLFARLINTTAGRLLIERANAFPRLLMPLTLGATASSVPPWVSTYAEALNSPARRRACWMFARSLRYETAWLRALWTHRARLHDRPVLLCWGLADPAFGTEATLRRWQSLFPDAVVHRQTDIGHYVPAEMPRRFATLVDSFLRSTSP